MWFLLLKWCYKILTYLLLSSYIELCYVWRDGLIDCCTPLLTKMCVCVCVCACVHSCMQEVCGLKWSSDDRLLASGANDNQVNIWEKTAITPLHTFTEHQSAIKVRAMQGYHWLPYLNLPSIYILFILHFISLTYLTLSIYLSYIYLIIYISCIYFKLNVIICVFENFL